MPQLDENDEPLRIHVGNIPFAWTIEDLRHQFQVFGPVRDPEIVANDRGSKVTIENLQLPSPLSQVYSNNRTLSSTLYGTPPPIYCAPIGSASPSVAYNTCISQQQQAQKQSAMLPLQSLSSSPTSSLFSPIELPFSLLTPQISRTKRTNVVNNVFGSPIRSPSSTRVTNLVQSCPQCSRLY
ncbi:unnamed protein product [Didymodactylos carnosus]|uniref:RRM domain-containing protein n=1 Tax=Didymodactylos carnosus TaxID=1234261 RepID=A0A813PNK7_9BILA|nr:unnamed protein product [Didymodactylos carnosus]CAF1111647.1 unnamed protein product [Didymodactylos carnosus]CAF3533046.1 unnamed protein product [Didymodactylos carnosus]CAF3879762.1 unnamed protein product [Didymodactylos carnosus]